jgi:hypothetical protein
MHVVYRYFFSKKSFVKITVMLCVGRCSDALFLSRRIQPSTHTKHSARSVNLVSLAPAGAARPRLRKFAPPAVVDRWRQGARADSTAAGHFHPSAAATSTVTGASTASGDAICYRGPLHRVSSPRAPVARKTRVADVCFRCFRGMLQMFRTDVAYVAMVCTRMLQASVSNVSSVF